MSARTHLVIPALALVVSVALAGAASAQGNSVVQLTADSPEPPEALPGTYETVVGIELMHPQGVCGCTQTTVELSVTDAPWAEDVSFDPASVTFNWIEHRAQAPQGDGQTAEVTLSFDVPGSMAGEGTEELTIEGNATSDGPTHEVDVAPTQIAVHFPGEFEPTVERGEVTADPAPKADDDGTAGAGSGSSRDASTSASDEPSENQAPGLEAGVAVLAVAGLALAMRRL